MSSDGSIDKPRSVRPARGDDRGLAAIALGVLLALAIVATVVMVFSDNPVWTRIGTLAALWAAFIGAFLVAKYRRLAAAESARVHDLHTVYELQLEREISARREHELVVEKGLRDTVRSETSDSIHALRLEVAALREQLGQMGVTLPEDRFAVSGHAPAGQLGAGSALPSVPSERVEPRRRGFGPTDPTPAAPSHTTPAPTTPAPTTPAPSSAEAAGPGVGRDATPSTERTEKFSPVSEGSRAAGETRAAAPGGDQQRRPAVRPTTRSQPVSTAPSAEPRKQPAPKPEPTPAAPKPEPTPAAPKPEPASTDATPPSRHGEGEGLSVAELMARLGGDNTSGGGRRRRHSSD
ncbi:DUF6779 domain-containing protein [Rhodococcus sp. IEGM 1408]|uniref:DUF6779 domain-containing protein n=1 Tax=Rhodococcus sp. IEGM 1408 TaxID=3082220 RepID=UPI002953D2E5|nr:DUF6779 domain-containing protein [Rhodococcus sp. IEGM 1408]MDV8002317.1 DUF6779 domain-containing protein [Rhodococcus sp. IEGM 1408]